MESVTRQQELPLNRSDEHANAAVVEDLFAQHGPLLLALAHTITHDWAEADDIVQATYEIALRRIDQLRDRSAARSWLIRIESREAFRVGRRVRRHVPLEAHIEDLEEDSTLESAAALRGAVSSLPPRVRAAILLHYYAGLSVEDTAAGMGVSANTVKTQLRKGLEKLRRELQ
jgi:RNA polymerase sigma factor (sigma-70 family)